MALVYSPEVPSGRATPQGAPPSPTLTNPDMILPRSYSGFSSPSPDRILASSPTLRNVDFALPSVLSSSAPDPGPDMGIPSTVKMRAKPVAPSSQYQAFSGYEHGAPLSDIGEEETIASTTPRSRATRDSRSPSPVQPLSPTTPRFADGEQTPRNRRSSLDESSDGSDIGDWENFDSSKMMSGRLAADVAKGEDLDAMGSKRNSFISPIDRDEMAILNDKAEEILANARKRLTHMEDNLTKARTSVLWSPRSSPNIADYHHPAGSLYRSISLAGANKRYSRPVISTSSPNHARGSSDTTPTGLKRLSMIPEARSSSAQEYASKLESPQYYSRSSPATRLVAHSPSSSVNSPMRTLEEEEAQDKSPSTSKTSPESHAQWGLGIDTLTGEPKEQPTRQATSPTLVRSASAASLGRPESAASTRSIRESMSDLRLRINDLKAKAQADKEKRVHSRNTPSPFTNANPETWYTSSPEYKQAGSPINANAGQGWSPRHDRQSSLDAQVTPQPAKTVDFLQPPETPQAKPPLTPGARTDQNTPHLHTAPLKVISEARDSVMDESQYEDAAQTFDDEPVAASEEEQIYLNEVLEESLQDVEPEVPDLPEYMLAEANAERHEDRLDAFDYENMFLHSAMGNYRGAEDTESSDSDTESVETSRADQSTPTAGHRSDGEDTQKIETVQDEDEQDDDTDANTEVPDSVPTPRVVNPQPPSWLKSMRSNSVETVSTEASFATATEGEDEDDVPHEILNWGNNVHAFPTPPVTSPRRETAPNVVFPPPGESPRVTSPKSPKQHLQSSPVLREAPVLRVKTSNGHQSNGVPTPTRSPANSVSSRSVKSIPRSTRSLQPTPDPPSEGPSEHPANTEILMESLIKLADPDFKVDPPSSLPSPASGKSPSPTMSARPGVFAEVDKDLVLALLREVGQVCNGVLKAEKRRQGEEVKLLRKRLDNARQVLAGQSEQEHDER